MLGGGYWKIKRKHNLFGKKVLISVASTWNDLKGFSDICMLSQSLAPNNVILLIGKMTRRLRKQLPSNVINIPRIYSKMEMAEYYNISDLYLNCTYCDTYPTVNLEAISCGTDVITYKVGGSTEIVENMGGYIVDKGDIDMLATLILNYSVQDIKSVRNDILLDNSFFIQNYVEIYK